MSVGAVPEHDAVGGATTPHPRPLSTTEVWLRRGVLLGTVIMLLTEAYFWFAWWVNAEFMMSIRRALR